MVISSDFRMGEHRDDDHEEDAPYFISSRHSSIMILIKRPLYEAIGQDGWANDLVEKIV